MPEWLQDAVLTSGSIVNTSISALYGLLLVALLFNTVRYLIAVAHGSDKGRDIMRAIGMNVILLAFGASIFGLVYILQLVTGLNEPVEVVLPRAISPSE